MRFSVGGFPAAYWIVPAKLLLALPFAVETVKDPWSCLRRAVFGIVHTQRAFPVRKRRALAASLRPASVAAQTRRADVRVAPAAVMGIVEVSCLPARAGRG